MVSEPDGVGGEGHPEADPSLYERDARVDTDPDGPDVAGWELAQISFDCPQWKSPTGDRVKVVQQGDKYPLFARGEAIKHGSYDRDDAIRKAVEWMHEHPATQQTFETLEEGDT